jgi:hypothetical protein
MLKYKEKRMSRTQSPSNIAIALISIISLVALAVALNAVFTASPSLGADSTIFGFILLFGAGGILIASGAVLIAQGLNSGQNGAVLAGAFAAAAGLAVPGLFLLAALPDMVRRLSALRYKLCPTPHLC